MPLGAESPSVEGRVSPGMIIFLVSLRYQSNVRPMRLSQKRRSVPKSRVSIICQVMSLSTSEGVSYLVTFCPLPPIQEDCPPARMDL